MEADGAIQMEHDLRELRGRLVKGRFSTTTVDVLWSARENP